MYDKNNVGGIQIPEKGVTGFGNRRASRATRQSIISVRWPRKIPRAAGAGQLPAMQHFLNFFPEPQGQGSFRLGWA